MKKTAFFALGTIFCNIFILRLLVLVSMRFFSSTLTMLCTYNLLFFAISFNIKKISMVFSLYALCAMCSHPLFVKWQFLYDDVKKYMKIRCRLKINFNLSSITAVNIIQFRSTFLLRLLLMLSELNVREKMGVLHAHKNEWFYSVSKFAIETIQNETGCGWNRENLSFSIGRKI